MSGYRLCVNLTPDSKIIVNGVFSFNAYKACAEQFRGLALDQYIDDGTLIGILVIEDPNHKTRWGLSNGIPMATVDAMCAVWKGLYPKVQTIVRAAPTTLASYPTWHFLDCAWGNYSALFGDVNLYVQNQKRAAQELGLQIMWGLNCINGGTTDPNDTLFFNRVGSQAGSFSMGSAAIRSYGTAICRETYSKGFIPWKYDATYITLPGIVEAFTAVRATLDSTGADVPTTPPTVPPPTTVPPPPPPQIPPGAITIAVGESWQAKVNANPDGAAFSISTGTHVRQSVIPKPGNKFFGQAGAIMDGQNATDFAFSGTAPDLLFSGLEIKGYHGGGSHLGAIQGFSAVRWSLININSHDNTYFGANLRGSFTVTGGTYHHNGQMGLTVTEALNSVIDGAELSYNNLAGAHDPLFDAGAIKVSDSNGMVMRNVKSHHNNGPGIWYDINNQNSLLENNNCYENKHAGIFYEISYNGIIRGNTCTNNGTADTNHTGAGILVSESSSVQVYNNTVVAANSHGIIALQVARGSGTLGLYQVKNLDVHGNTVTLPDGKRSGMLNFIDATDRTAMLSSRGNLFNNNTYTIVGNSLPFFGGTLTGISKVSWQALGQDLTSSFSATTGITIAPGENWQTKVNANPNGTVFRILPGTHVRPSVIPKPGNQFLGDVGAIMDGQNVTPHAFIGFQSPFPANVVIRGLEIKQYASPVQLAAIAQNRYQASDGAAGWVTENNNVHHNANVGIRCGTGAICRNNNVHHNSQLGIGGIGNDLTVTGNEIAFNNPNLVGNLNFEAGGTKFVGTNRLVLRGNYCHHNNGPGLWLDIANENYLIEDNRCEDNLRDGIAIEISFGGIIRNNITRRQGLDDPRAANFPWSPGISVAASGGRTGGPRLEIYGNRSEGDRTAIGVVQQNRGSNYGDPGPIDAVMLIKNLDIHNNTIILLASVPGHLHAGSLGATTFADDTGTGGLFSTTRSITIDFNIYDLDGIANPFAWNGGYRSASYWTNTAHFDLHGTITP